MKSANLKSLKLFILLIGLFSSFSIYTLSELQKEEILKIQQQALPVPTAPRPIRVIGQIFTTIQENLALNTTTFSYYLNDETNPEESRQYKLDTRYNNIRPLISGSKVAVQGMLYQDTIIVSPPQYKGFQTIDEIKTTSILGPQNTLTLLTYFKPTENVKEPTSLNVSQAQEILKTVNDYYQENSFQKTNLAAVIDRNQSADVKGWYAIPTPEICDLKTFLDQIITKVGSEINLNQYNRLIIITMNENPDQIAYNSCTETKFATLGDHKIKTNQGDKTLSVSWFSNVKISAQNVIRALGNNFGLQSANFIYCNENIIKNGDYPNLCPIEPNGDTFSSMGSGNFTHFNAMEKEKIGWLEKKNLKEIKKTGEYQVTLKPLEALSEDIQLVKIPVENKIIEISYRQPFGLDNGISRNSDVFLGAQLHFINYYGNSLFDPVNPISKEQTALKLGETFEADYGENMRLRISTVDNKRDLYYSESSKLIMGIQIIELKKVD